MRAVLTTFSASVSISASSSLSASSRATSAPPPFPCVLPQPPAKTLEPLKHEVVVTRVAGSCAIRLDAFQETLFFGDFASKFIDFLFNEGGCAPRAVGLRFGVEEDVLPPVRLREA